MGSFQPPANRFKDLKSRGWLKQRIFKNPLRTDSLEDFPITGEDTWIKRVVTDLLPEK